MDSALFVGPLDRVLLLRTLPMLEALGPVHLAAIAQHAQERTLPRETALHVAGEAAEAVHLIVEGEVAARREDGRLHVLGPGDAVGFINMLSRSRRRLEAQTTTETVVLELPWDAQLDVCAQHFPVVVEYLRYLARATVEEVTGEPSRLNALVPSVTWQSFARPLTLVDRVVVLSGSQAFSASCLDALAELAHHVTEMHFASGASIWNIDDPADHFHLIVSGNVECEDRTRSSFGRGAGAALGIYAALQGKPRWFRATASTDVVALRIDVDLLLDILEDHFDLALDFMAVLANSLLDLQQASRG